MRWKMKPGYGKHYYIDPKTGEKSIIRPGGMVTCSKEYLGGAIDKFDALDPPEPPPQPTTGLRLKERGGGWWDVVNPANGKTINDEALRFPEASALAGRQVEEPEPEADGA